MIVDVPDHHATNVSIMLASIGYYMIRENKDKRIPTELHQLAPIFNQLTEDDDSKGDFFETIAQKFPDVRDIIRQDPTVRANTSYKDWA